MNDFQKLDDLFARRLANKPVPGSGAGPWQVIPGRRRFSGRPGVCDQPPLAQAAKRLERQMRSADQSIAQAMAHWKSIDMPMLSSIVACRMVRQTLEVQVRSAAVKFELDRLMRSGLERETIRACSSPISSIRVRFGDGRD